jgi:perosamine synthetase
MLPKLDGLWPPPAKSSTPLSTAGFRRSREILSVLPATLDLPIGSVILMPESICWEALSPILASSLKTEYYALGPKLNPDLGDIDRLWRQGGRSARAVYVVHYFGFEIDNLREIKEWCRKNGLYLIEDCALSHYDGETNGGAGIDGDLAFFSLWKTMPIPEGALATKKGVVLELPVQRSLGCLEGVLRCSLRGWRRVRRSVPERGVDPDPVLTSMYGMCRVARWIWCRLNAREAGQIRRRNFEFLLEGLNKQNRLKPLRTDLGPRAVPYSLPLIVDDAQAFQDYMRAKGSATELGLNRSRHEKKSLGIGLGALSDRVVAIPCHQGLSDSDLNFLRDSVGLYLTHRSLG